MAAELASKHEPEQSSKTAWLFPGQGSQFVGMGKDLCEEYKEIENLYNRANEILGYSISDISFFEDPEGNDRLNKTIYTQPAVFLYSCATVMAAKIEGNSDFSSDPDYIAPQSFGIYSALVFAGSLSFEDGLKLVKARAEAAQMVCDQMESEDNPGGMMATRTNRENPLLDEALELFGLDVCSINSSRQVVIGGPIEKLKKAEAWLKEKGISSTLLDISGVFHTRLMKPAVERFKQALNAVDLKDARIPIIGNTTAKPIRTKEEIKQELLDQFTNPVRWQESMQFLKDQGISKTLEVGKTGVLSRINKPLLGGVAALATLGLAAVYIWRRQHDQQ